MKYFANHDNQQQPTLWKKRPITLIEMIVVMILIATITGALAYNYRESLNEGRAFKTKEGISRIEDILTIYMAEHPEVSFNELVQDWQNVIRKSALIKNPEAFFCDGWGNPYEVRVMEGERDGSGVKIVVTSKAYLRYKEKKGIR